MPGLPELAGQRLDLALIQAAARCFQVNAHQLLCLRDRLGVRADDHQIVKRDRDLAAINRPRGQRHPALLERARPDKQ